MFNHSEFNILLPVVDYVK